MAEEVLWTGFDDKGLYAVRANKDENGNVIHETYATKSELEGKQDVISDLTNIREGAEAGATAVQPDDLATVATSGSYNDLSNKPDVIDAVEYDSSNKKILFKAGETLVDEIDATDFIKDGMVNEVKIDNGNLVITFNTDAGKEDITIPLSEIFDPDNYYDKDSVDELLGNKVDKVDGKQLSTEDYTTDEKTKLAGVETGAQVNVIEGVSVNGSPLTPENKTVNVEIPEQKQADWKQTDREAVDYIKNKPTQIDIAAGDGISIVQENDKIVISTDVDASTKADKVSGATDGHFAGLDANGNLTDSGSNAADFATAEQGIKADTAYQKPSEGIPATDLEQTVQDSLGRADTAVQPATLEYYVQKDGDKVLSDNNYTDAEKAKLEGIAVGAEVNIQSDWNQSDDTADDFIKNKPTIPAAQVNADWDATEGVAEILHKPESIQLQAGTGIDIEESGSNIVISSIQDDTKADKVSSATSGNFAGLDANGNLTDSGSKASDFATAAQGALAATAVQPGDLATVATSGSYNDLSDVPSSLAITGGTGISIQESPTELIISTNVDPASKADKVSSPTNGNLAALDATGNLTDSGYKAADFKKKQTAVVDPTAFGSAIEFIDTLAQDANGEITATKKSVQTAVASSSGVGGSAGVMSAADKEKLDGVSAGAEANVIDTVKVNGTALTPDAQKAVDVDVPITEIQVNGAAVTPTNHMVDLTIPDAANDGTLSITVGSAQAQTFTADQSTNTTVTVPLAASASGSDPATEGLMSSADKDKLDHVAKPDWNATSGSDAEILNKPNPISIVAGSGINITEANDTITIAATGTDISGKADKVTGAVSGNFAGLDANGNLADSGSKASDFKTKQTAVVDPTASGSAIEFIDTLAQDANGEITATKKSVQAAVASTSGVGGSAGVMSAADKEKLDGIESGAEVNVKPDWEATAGSDAEILNKPDSVEIVGGTGITVTEDTTNHELVIASTVDVSGKADKAVPSTANNFAALNSSGNLADSGYSSSSFATAAQGALADSSIQGITVDSGSPLTPTSGVVNIDLSGKVDKVTGKGLSTNDYDNTDKATVTKAAAVIPSDATASNQLVSYDTMTAALAKFVGIKVSTGTGTDMHPDEPNPDTKTIYLVYDSSATGGDKYKEWIYSTTNTWTLIGDTTVDLSGYVQYPATHTDTHLVAFGPNESIADTGKTVADLTNSVETVSIGSGSGISPTSGTTDINIPLAANNNGAGTDGAMAGGDKVKLDSIATGAQVNTVNTVSIGSGSGILPTTGTTDINIPLATSSVDGAMSSTDKGKLDGITDGAEPNVQSDWNVTDNTSDAYIANKPDIIIPQASPAAQGGISAPKYLMVVTTMPPSAQIDPDTIYLVQGTYIGT